MLHFIRERATSWVSAGFLCLMALAMGLWGMQSYFQGGKQSGVVVEVNKHKISRQVLGQQVRQLKTNLAYRLGPQAVNSEQVQRALKQQALKRLIEVHVTADALADEGFAASPELIRRSLQAVPMLQENGQFSAARLRAHLRSLNISEEGFLQQAAQDVQTQQLQRGMIESAFVLPAELQQLQALQNQKRAFHYLTIKTTALTPKRPPNAAAIQAYYAAHPTEFQQPEAVRIAYVDVKLGDLKRQQKFSDQQLLAFYQQNQDNFVIPAQVKLEKVYFNQSSSAKVDSNGVAVLSKRYSSTPQQAELLAKRLAKYQGKFAVSVHDAAAWQALPSLPRDIAMVVHSLKSGQFSLPVETPNGVVVYHVTGAKPAQARPFAEVKIQVQARLAQVKAEQAFAALNEQLADLAYSDPDSLSAVAKAAGVSIKTTSWIEQSNPSHALFANPKLLTAAFSEPLLVDKLNSEPIHLTANRTIVMRLAQHRTARTKPLAQVRSQIVRTLQQQQAAQSADSLVEQLLAAQNNPKQLTALLNKHQLRWHTVGLSKRDKLGHLPAAVVQQAFAQSPSQKTLASIGTPDGIVLLGLDQVKVPKRTQAPDLNQPQAQDYRLALGRADFIRYYESWVRAAHISFTKLANDAQA